MVKRKLSEDAAAVSTLGAWQLNPESYTALLKRLIGVSEKLQNNPAQGLVPHEDLASDLVMEMLAPYSVELGGPLKIERVTFVVRLITLRGFSVSCSLSILVLKALSRL